MYPGRPRAARPRPSRPTLSPLVPRGRVSMCHCPDWWEFPPLYLPAQRWPIALALRTMTRHVLFSIHPWRLPIMMVSMVLMLALNAAPVADDKQKEEATEKELFAKEDWYKNEKGKE